MTSANLDTSLDSRSEGPLLLSWSHTVALQLQATEECQGVKVYRGFESLSLRQFQYANTNDRQDAGPSICGEPPLLRAERSNLDALGIAGGTGILPVILMDRRDACRSIDSSQ